MTAFKNPNRPNRLCFSRYTLLLLLQTALMFCPVLTPAVDAQQKNEEEKKLALLRGSVAHTGDFSKENVKFTEIKTSLHQQVTPPSVPVPRMWGSMSAADRQQWLKAFQESDKGKQFIANRDKLIKEAPVFEIVFEDDGKFVVYDIPPGTYGLQGRVDKDINGVVHAFEVFAKIMVGKTVEVVDLKPIPVVTTPLFKAGQAAPKIGVKNFDGSKTFDFDSEELKGKYVFLNFWFSGDPDVGYQKKIQEMYVALKDKHPIVLVSIALDEDRKKAVGVIKAQKYAGLHGFTDGWDNRVVEGYGIRSTPSGWLVAPNGKISMTQHEFFRAIKATPSVTEVISRRIEGKDKPTLATRPETDDKEKESSDN